MRLRNNQRQIGMEKAGCAWMWLHLWLTSSGRYVSRTMANPSHSTSRYILQITYTKFQGLHGVGSGRNSCCTKYNRLHSSMWRSLILRRYAYFQALAETITLPFLTPWIRIAMNGHVSSLMGAHIGRTLCQRCFAPSSIHIMSRLSLYSSVCSSVTIHAWIEDNMTWSWWSTETCHISSWEHGFILLWQ